MVLSTQIFLVYLKIKVTWVWFPTRISTVFIKLLPINDSVFQFLTKHVHDCYKFFYRISDHEICTTMLYKFCKFFQIFFITYSPFKLYLQCCKQWIWEVCNFYFINQRKPILTYFRNWSVPSDIYFSALLSTTLY